jgi:hypothetical protein
MSDRTEEEEERYIRREARWMKVHPARLEELLSAQGFVLVSADRADGANRIEFLRPTPGKPGLFDSVDVHADIRGESPSFYLGQSILPGFGQSVATCVNEYVPATRFGYPKDDFDITTAAEAKLFEHRFSEALPRLWEEFWVREGRALYEDSIPSIHGAERILQQLQATDNLPETLARLRSNSTPEQQAQATAYINGQTLDTYNLQNFRIISELAALALYRYWEIPRPFSQTYHRNPKTWTADDIDAHRRFQIIASRLSREPGWPMVDPLVPNRHDPYENPTPWREGKPSRVAELIDEHLEASKRFCGCGKALYYKQHSLTKTKPPRATILVRCASGHHDTLEMNGWMGA